MVKRIALWILFSNFWIGFSLYLGRAFERLPNYSIEALKAIGIFYLIFLALYTALNEFAWVGFWEGVLKKTYQYSKRHIAFVGSIELFGFIVGLGTLAFVVNSLIPY